MKHYPISSGSLSRLRFGFLLVVCLCGVLCHDVAWSQDLRAKIREQELRLKYQREDIERLETENKELRRRKEQLGSANNELKKSVEKAWEEIRAIKQNRLTKHDSLRRENEALKEEIAASQKETLSLRAGYEERGKIIQDLDQRVMMLEGSRYHNPLMWILMALFLISLYTVFSLLHRVRRLRKSKALEAPTPTSPPKAVSIDCFAETIDSNGIFTRISGQASDEKKYVLQSLPNDETRAIFSLNQASRYYQHWVDDPSLFLKQGVEVAVMSRETHVPEFLAMHVGFAVYKRGEWHVVQPILLEWS